jgi:hypothetical protein
MIWLLATCFDGTTFEYGIPLSEPFWSLGRDADRFAQLEVLFVDYSYEG